MKIIFVIENLLSGGAERVSANLANELSIENEVYMLTYTSNKVEYLLKKEVRRINSNILKTGRVSNIKERIAFLKHTINSIRPNIVISLGMPKTQFILSVLLYRSPYKLILSERNDPVMFPKSKLDRCLRKIAYTLADVVVFQTSGARDYFNKHIVRKSKIIPNPIDENLPIPHVGDREKTIVTFCRLSSQKNLHLLLKSFSLINREFSDYKLLIYGEGELKQNLIEYSKELGVYNQVEFKGYSSNIHEEILYSSLFVSSSDYEGISNSMMEALGIGLPCVCTDCPPGGAKSVIKNYYNGILVPVKDPIKLANAMKKVISDNELKKNLSLHASEVRECYSIKRIAGQWLRL